MQFKINDTLVLTFETGVDGEGKPVFAKRSFRAIQEDADPAAMYAAAHALASLQTAPLYKVEQTSTYELAE
ncbi:DUF1659 domain-containing protein [Alkalicoccus urumqiensis]|uniref:DUF1659 domain-containing protein n=1 Tax=Alkalicoccus urumqiensis TaxID=1548213 RepID=A0A2P6MDY4_ALKUR|nr:DUF1659 domain-containing protein [Alkalicoccus urumqiensis]PRO64487.1 hypothetical protein C6I21_14260 [Alkalicoccus urumqiensis]